MSSYNFSLPFFFDASAWGVESSRSFTSPVGACLILSLINFIFFVLMDVFLKLYFMAVRLKVSAVHVCGRCWWKWCCVVLVTQRQMCFRKIAGVWAEKGFLICFIIISSFLRYVSGTRMDEFLWMPKYKCDQDEMVLLPFIFNFMAFHDIFASLYLYISASI